MKLTILFDHPSFLVIDKPAGLSVHNETLNESSVISILGKEFFLVHRLDKETSGVLLLAKSKSVATELANEFQQHHAEKTYFAMLRGSILEKYLTWNWPISDKSEGRKNPQGLTKDRVTAHTEVEIQKTNRYFSLAKIQIKTGRQHQIRKHAAIAKHAIIGDSRYGEPKYNTKVFEIYQSGRMFLHAAKLKIQYQNNIFEFEAPLPIEFSKLLA